MRRAMEALGMAQPATIRRFEIDVTNVDGGVYESVSLRVAQHPSESEAYCVVRVIAYCLHLGDGVRMSKSGLCDADEPPLSSESLTGEPRLWVDIGSPSADRLHKASKRYARVVVYTHKRPELLIDKLNKQRIHRADELELYALDNAAIEQLAARLSRSNNWSFIRQDDELFITAGESPVSFPLRALPAP